MAAANNFITLFSKDVGANADTVEWCPIPPYQNYFACGTYSCIIEENSNGKRVRNGAIILFSVTKQELKELSRLETSAILDMKWCPVLFNDTIVLGAATGSGEVRIYHLSDGDLKFVTNINLNKFGAEDFIILSIDWPKVGNNDMICCSDSNGYISTIKFENETLTKLNNWHAHTTEAWTACFDAFTTSVVYSGGDDNRLNVWDMRGSIPAKSGRIDHHKAGVTALSSHPTKENYLISGSYDETILLWDSRNFLDPIEKMNVNGGLWRLKWKCRDEQHHILAACIFAGFQVLNPFTSTCLGCYKEHESLAYGADWCHLEENALFDRDQHLMAVCSFYDHKLSVCLWDENARCQTKKE